MQTRCKIGANSIQNRYKLDYETDWTTKIAVFILVQNYLNQLFSNLPTLSIYFDDDKFWALALQY